MSSVIFKTCIAIICLISFFSCKKSDEVELPLICRVDFEDETINAVRKTLNCSLESPIVDQENCDLEISCLQVKAGEILVINGKKLSTTKLARINNFQCDIVPSSITDTSLKIIIPEVFSSGKISLETDFGTILGVAAIEVLREPRLTGLKDKTGIPNDILKVSGVHLKEKTLQSVNIGSCDSPLNEDGSLQDNNDFIEISEYNVTNANELSFIVPGFSESSFCVAIGVNNKIYPLVGEGNQFMLTTAPQIISFDPKMILIDERTDSFEVIIRGNNLAGVTEVSLNNILMEIDQNESSNIRMTLRSKKGDIDRYTSGVFVLKNSNFSVPTENFIVEKRLLLLDFDGNGSLDNVFQGGTNYNMTIDPLKTRIAATQDSNTPKNRNVAYITGVVTASSNDAGFWSIDSQPLGNNIFIGTGINSDDPSLVKLTLDTNNKDVKNAKLKIIIGVEKEQTNQQPPRKLVTFESIIEDIPANKWTTHSVSFDEFINTRATTDEEKAERPDVNQIKLIRVELIPIDNSVSGTIDMQIDNVYLEGAII